MKRERGRSRDVSSKIGSAKQRERRKSQKKEKVVNWKGDFHHRKHLSKRFYSPDRGGRGGENEGLGSF